jgi:CheY-like chemotaxis protein
VLYPLSYGGPGAGHSTSQKGPDRCRGAPVTATVQAVRPTAPRVLVVDDSEVIRELISVNLELEGFEVSTAEDGQDALDRIEQIRPDLVTLDVVMPRLDGFQTAARLRANAATRHIPVVMVSAAAQEGDLQRGREIGVNAYITKPFQPEELVQVVRDLTAGARDAD